MNFLDSSRFGSPGEPAPRLHKPTVQRREAETVQVQKVVHGQLVSVTVCAPGGKRLDWGIKPKSHGKPAPRWLRKPAPSVQGKTDPRWTRNATRR